MDAVDAYILQMHTLLGHDTACAYIGGPDYGRDGCVLCHPEIVDRTTPAEAMAVVAERRKAREHA